MINNRLASVIRQKTAEGMGMQAICNMLVQQGNDHLEVDEAARSIRQEEAMKASGMTVGDPYQAQPPALMSDRNMMLLVYAISIAIIVVSAAVAMYLFGMF